MNNGKAFISVFAGALIGAVLGILFAPHKGKSSRRRIQEKGNKLMLRMEKMLPASNEKEELLTP